MGRPLRIRQVWPKKKRTTQVVFSRCYNRFMIQVREGTNCEYEELLGDKSQDYYFKLWHTEISRHHEQYCPICRTDTHDILFHANDS